MKYTLLFTFLITCAFTNLNAQTLHTVEAGNFFFNPDTLTIVQGDTVTWVNTGGTHNVNAENNTLTGESYDNPESFISDPTSDAVLLTRVFEVTGTYNYDCSVGMHAANGMVAQLTVKENTTSTIELPNKASIDFTASYLPKQGYVDIKFNANQKSENASLLLSTISGQQIASERISVQNGENRFQMPLNNNTAGIYLISLNNNGEVFTEKLIVN